jgi:TP901 family phage tail tape measure protein
MAERTVKVTLQAVTQSYVTDMQKARKATLDTGTAAEKLALKKEGLESFGKVFATIGAAAAAGVGIAIKEFAEFDAQMSQLQTLSHATASDMDKLRNAALTMGQGIGFSATQVADAETELVKAGVSVSDILGGALKGSLNLAAAGQINVADATQIATIAMTQFGLKGKDVPHIADLLAAGADKALGSVSELGQALNQSGLVAAQFGLSVDDTVGTLAEFAQAGLLGSDAGTSLKQMFLQLASPSKQAAAEMKAAGFSAYDAQGKFIGITKLAGALNSSFSKMSDASRNSALSIIFGSDAIRAANVLMSDGAKGNQKWIKSVDDTGFAAQQAAGKTNNFKGDLKKLQAALESDLIRTGSSANGVLRTTTQSLTGLLNLFGQAPKPIQATVLVLGGVVAAVGLVGGGFLALAPRIASAKTAMDGLNISGGKLAKGIGKGSLVALALTTIATGLGNMNSTAALTADQLSDLNAAAKQPGIGELDKSFTTAAGSLNTFVNGTKGIKGALGELTGSGSFWLKVANGVDGVTFHLTGLGDTGRRLQAQFAQLGSTLAETAATDLPTASEQFNKLVKASGGGEDAVRKLLSVMPDYKAKLTDLASAQGQTLTKQQLYNLAQGKGNLAAVIAADSTKKQADALAKLTGNAASADQSISDLSDTIKGFGSAQLDTNSAQRDFQAAIDDAQKALKDNGKTLDITTEKGRANSAALDGIAQSAIAATAAIVNNGGSQVDATKQMQAGRDAYIAAAKAQGLSTDAAGKLADSLKLIPANVGVAFDTPGLGGSTQGVEQYKNSLAGVPKSKLSKLQADKADAESKIKKLKSELTDIPSKHNTLLAAQVAQAEKDLAGLQSKLNLIPRSVTTQANVNTAQAIAQVAALNAAIRSTGSTVHVATGTTSGGGSGLTRAGGGPVFGPGTSTSDSIPAMLSNGEFVVKASAVKRIGVPTLNQLNNGYANGGLVAKANAALSADQRALVLAQRAYQDAKGRAAKLRQLAQVRKLQDEIAQDKRALAAAKAAPSGPDRSDQISFRSSVRDGSFDAGTGVSNLYSMAEDPDKYTQKQRASFLIIANQQEKAFYKLQKQSDAAAKSVTKATDTLTDLQDKASSLASSVTGSLNDSGLSSTSSASSFTRLEAKKADRGKQLAAELKKLQAKGVAPALLAEIASLGIDQGLKMAQSFDGLSLAQIKSVNASYNSVQSTATSIGSQISKAEFGTQIKTAQAALDNATANAKKITSAIDAQTKLLEKVLSKALGTGFSTGGFTGNGGLADVAGLVHGREFVVNARATAQNRGLLEAMNRGLPGYAAGGYVHPTYISSSGGVTAGQMQSIARAVAAEMPRAEIQPQFHAHPVQNLDPETALTIMSRELTRGMAGMVE